MASNSNLAATIVLLSFCLLGITAEQCSRNHQCYEYSFNPNAVTCDQGECRCLSEFGVDGSATEENPCTCESPKQYQNIRGQKYCIDLSFAIRAVVEDYRCEILKEKVTQVYQRMVYPISKSMISGQISAANLFSSDVNIRATPWANFYGYQSVLEFFYGMNSFVLDQTRNVTISKLTCEGNRVSVQTTITNNFLPGYPMPPLYNITQVGEFTFDSSNLIISAEISILNPGALLDGPPVATYRDAAIANTCGTFTGPSTYSLNPNGTCPEQFNGSTNEERKQDCINFMKSIAYGTWNRANANSYICRQYHSLFTPYRPEVWCPVIGKTGAGVCVDVPYNSFYAESF
jgi:hypothetical protein